MAYIPPTAADIKARFPAFIDVSNTLIDLVIAEALLQVDETWLETDYATAITYLVAHLLASEGVLGDASGISLLGIVQSERLGDAAITYRNDASVPV